MRLPWLTWIIVGLFLPPLLLVMIAVVVWQLHCEEQRRQRRRHCYQHCLLPRQQALVGEPLDTGFLAEAAYSKPNTWGADWKPSDSTIVSDLMDDLGLQEGTPPASSVTIYPEIIDSCIGYPVVDPDLCNHDKLLWTQLLGDSSQLFNPSLFDGRRRLRYQPHWLRLWPFYCHRN